MRNIKRRTLPTYQVGSKLYKSLKAASKAEAWAMICEKYCNSFDVAKLSDVTHLHGMDCDCETASEAEMSGDMCQIHCRKYGYFSRLHKRLSRLIEKHCEGI